VLAVGILVGLEIPLVMRILKRQFRGQAGARYGFGNLVSQVLTFDYLGALAVSIAFPLLLVPQLGLVRTGALFGLMNAAVAVWALWLFRAELRHVGAHALACALTIAALVAALAGADRITTRRGPLLRRPCAVQRDQPVPASSSPRAAPACGCS
jgi:spermidine synthase